MTPGGHLKIRLTKGRDGPNILTCVRPDGSRTWSKVSDFFPVHDLSHYTVESTLGLERAFYGLILTGWDIEDFSSPGAASRTPPEAIVSEVMVGVLQREVLMSQGATPEEYNAEVSAALDGLGCPGRRHVTNEEFEALKLRLRGLLDMWRVLEAGESLEVNFLA